MLFDSVAMVHLLTASVMLLGLCLVIYRVIFRSPERVTRCSPDPVRIGMLRRLRTALNPGRLRLSHWKPAEATIKQTYPVRRGAFATVVGFPKLGFRISSPLRSEWSYSNGIWYLYLADGKTRWGEHQFVVGYETQEEADEQARALLGKTIKIVYDPDFPDDSRPIFESSLGPAHELG
jgi:hypothetical protein